MATLHTLRSDHLTVRLSNKRRSLLAPSLALALIVACESLLACLPSFAAELFLAQRESELSIADAKQYMISLINKDRKSVGLKEVASDEIAERAGNLHSDEMAKQGYLSHWDRLGRKPDQRYCSVGGTGFVMENGHIEFSGFSSDGEGEGGGGEFTLDADAKISKKTIEGIEAEFINEQPPNDGHRRNILDPDHTKVGIGLSVAKKGDSLRLACVQEFVHDYGKVEISAESVNVGESFVVKGSLDPGLTLQSVDLFRDEFPKPMTLKELDETHSYGPPQLRINTYFPGSQAAVDALTISDKAGRQEFSCRFATDKTLWKPGLYYVYVWARPQDPNRKTNLVVASKTIEVR